MKANEVAFVKLDGRPLSPHQYAATMSLRDELKSIIAATQTWRDAVHSSLAPELTELEEACRNRIETIEHALASLDTAPETVGGFRAIPHITRWENRAKAYEYRL